MYSEKITSEINRLKFEDFLWVVFAILCLINVYGDCNDKEYLKTHNNTFRKNSNKIFEFTLIVTFLIYIYFFIRNYKAYVKATEEEKRLYVIKVLGSAFLIAGVLCLLYFQDSQSSFIGSPAI